MVFHHEPVPEALPELPEISGATTCCHHWIIEMANGPISRGVCQNCSESRDFTNSTFSIERDLPDTPSREETVAKESMAALEE